VDGASVLMQFMSIFWVYNLHNLFKYFLDFFFSTLDELSYHSIADETLDTLAELFEDLGESPSSPTDYDVQLSVSSKVV